jgi:predicted transposase/invertase (TIGR01784 family)
MPELLDPKVDFVFKRIFGDERNKDVLVHFLNSIFESAHEPLIESVEILNPYLDKDALTDKMSVLDIRARTTTRTLINIEIQLWNAGDMQKRTLYYWAKLYTGQMEEGDQYRTLQKSITVNVLDFITIENDQYHNVFHVREDKTGQLLTDALEIHFLELRKLRNELLKPEQRLVRWMLFLSSRTRENMEELAKEDPVMLKALTTLEFLSQDEEARQLYEARQKALHDHASAIGAAREQGRKERDMEFARQLLAEGEPLERVARLTGLSPLILQQLTSD